MTTLEIVDTAVKIGLGAIIASMSSYLLTKQNNNYEIDKNLKDDRKKLIMELAIKIESVEVHSNEALVHFHNNDLVGAKQALIPATNEVYSARAIANILGDDNLVEYIESLSEIIESIYGVYAFGENTLNELTGLMSDIAKVKKLAYPNIRLIYKSKSS